MKKLLAFVFSTACALTSVPAAAQQVTFPLQTGDDVEFVGKVGTRSWYAERRYLSAAPNHATYAMLEGAGPGQSVGVRFFEVDCDLRLARLIAVSEGLTQDAVRVATRWLNSPWLPISTQHPRDTKARSVCMELALFSGPY